MNQHTDPASTEWTAERIAALGVVTDLPTAAAILCLTRSHAYELAKQGRFPVPLIRAGTRYRVPVALLLAALGVQSPTGATGLDPGPQPSVDQPGSIRSINPDPTRSTMEEQP